MTAPHLDKADRVLVHVGSGLLRLGLTTVETIEHKAGFSNSAKKQVAALALQIAETQGVAPAPLDDVRLILHIGSRLLAEGWATPELIEANLISPDVPNRQATLDAVLRLAGGKYATVSQSAPVAEPDYGEPVPEPKPTEPAGVPTSRCVEGVHRFDGMTDPHGRPVCGDCGQVCVTEPQSGPGYIPFEGTVDRSTLPYAD
jgi:hypothetical protein